MKDWSKDWKSSSHARKQRKYRYNAPAHIKSGFIASHLSKELRQKHNKRAIALRKGDSVKILRGRFKGQTGKIDVVDRHDLKVYIEGFKIAKKDGTEVPVALDASNLIITSLNMDDKKRIKSKEAKTKPAAKPAPAKKAEPAKTEAAKPEMEQKK